MQLFLSSSFSRGLSSIFCFVFFFFFFFYMYDYGNWLLNKPNFVSLFSTSGQRFFKLRCEEIRNFHPQIFDVDLIRKLSPSVIDPGIKYLTLPALTFILKVNLFWKVNEVEQIECIRLICYILLIIFALLYSEKFLPYFSYGYYPCCIL